MTGFGGNFPQDTGGADFSGLTPEDARHAFSHLPDQDVDAIVAKLEQAKADARDSRETLQEWIRILAEFGRVAIKVLA